MESLPPGIVSPPWSLRTKRTVALIVLLLVGVFAWRLSAIWSPLIISLVLAFLLNPWVNVFQRAIPFGGPNFRRSLATVLAFVLAIIVVVTAISLLVPPIVDQLQQFGEGIPALVDEIREEVMRVLDTPIPIGGQSISLLDLIQGANGNTAGSPTSPAEVDVIGAVQTFLAPLVSPVLGALGGAVSSFLNALFVLVMVFYLMRDGPRFASAIETLTPLEYRGDVRYLLRRLGMVWDAYLRGQLLLCLIMGVAGFLAATALGLPSPLVLGLLNGILEFIPNLGPFLALVPATAFALVFPSTTIPGLHGVVFGLVVILTWTGLQNLEALFVVPHVMGDHLDLHPVVVIVAVIGGASLAGALGVILAAPTVATLRVFGEYIYTKLLDQPPPRLGQDAVPSGPGLPQRLLEWGLRVTGRRSSAGPRKEAP